MADTVLAGEAAEVLLPDGLAILEIVGVQVDVVAIPEDGIDTRAVGGRRRGGQRVERVNVGLVADGRRFPQDFSRGGVETDEPTFPALAGGGLQEDTSTVDDRRRVADAGDRRFP